VSDRISGSAIRAIRDQLEMDEVEFALLFGVTVRSVQLWESEVVVPSVLTSMVIRAESEKQLSRSPRPAEVPGRSQRQSARSRTSPRRDRQRA
jgi:hypothetical protein